MVNLTPHDICVRLADGRTIVLEASGLAIARVATSEGDAGVLRVDEGEIPIIHRRTGEAEGLPPEGTPCLVSGMVLAAVPGRRGVFAPDTGPTAIRDGAGHIVAVTRLVQA